MTNLLVKIIGKLKQISRRAHNMQSHPTEQYYYKLYWSAISQFIKPSSNVLEIGCQHGRFTIPMINMGHRVHATDIHAHYFSSIQKHLGNSKHVSFTKETIHQTLASQSIADFDCVLCLELLYTMADHQQIIADFGKKMKKGSLFIASHRSIGYYIYRFLKENNLDQLARILKNEDPVFNAQDENQLRKLYNDAGFDILSIKPIGVFSGLLNDPFAAIADPGKMASDQLNQLQKLEEDPKLQSLFSNNARYHLVIATLT